MSAHLKPTIQSFKAGVSLNGLQYTLVKFGADKDTVIPCGADEKAVGVLMSAPSTTVGEVVEVAVDGGAKVKCGGAVTLGESVGSMAGGVLKDQASASGSAIGVAMDSGVLNDIIPILIDRHIVP